MTNRHEIRMQLHTCGNRWKEEKKNIKSFHCRTVFNGQLMERVHQFRCWFSFTIWRFVHLSLRCICILCVFARFQPLQMTTILSHFIFSYIYVQLQCLVVAGRWAIFREQIKSFIRKFFFLRFFLSCFVYLQLSFVRLVGAVVLIGRQNKQIISFQMAWTDWSAIAWNDHKRFVQWRTCSRSHRTQMA